MILFKSLSRAIWCLSKALRMDLGRLAPYVVGGIVGRWPEKEEFTTDYLKCERCRTQVKVWDAWRTPKKSKLCKRCFGDEIATR